MPFWNRFFSQQLDLDNFRLGDHEIGRTHESTCPPRSAEIIARFVNAALYHVLSEGRIAMNVFHDQEDRCLRMLMYASVIESADSGMGEELIPAVGSIAGQVLDYLRRAAGIGPKHPEGVLHYRYRNADHQAACVAPNPHEVRVYFTGERPPMRTKITPPEAWLEAHGERVTEGRD